MTFIIKRSKKKIMTFRLGQRKYWKGEILVHVLYETVEENNLHYSLEINSADCFTHMTTKN